MVNKDVDILFWCWTQTQMCRIYGNMLVLLQTIQMGIVMYAPAVALEAVVQLPSWISITATAAVAILYTTLVVIHMTAFSFMSNALHDIRALWSISPPSLLLAFIEWLAYLLNCPKLSYVALWIFCMCNFQRPCSSNQFFYFVYHFFHVLSVLVVIGGVTLTNGDDDEIAYFSVRWKTRKPV